MKYLYSAIGILIFVIGLLILPCGQAAVITHDNINVRTDATIQATAIGQLHQGDTVEIIDQSFEWVKVVLPERFHCYAWASFIKLVAANTGTVTATVLNLRLAPSLQAPVIGKVSQGQQLSLFKKYKEDPQWYEVKGYPYVSGWVHKKFVQLDPVEGEDKESESQRVRESKSQRVRGSES